MTDTKQSADVQGVAVDRLVMCRCGCGNAAAWLCTGNDYDPHAPGGKGPMFFDEPTCTSAMLYLEESAAELGLPFRKRPAHNRC